MQIHQRPTAVQYSLSILMLSILMLVLVPAVANAQVGQIAKLTAGVPNQVFGFSVALDGDTALVGAYLDHSGTGAAYTFRRNLGGANSWGQEAKLMAEDGNLHDGFGWAVAIDGDTAIVGARQDSMGGPAPGYAYIFSRSALGDDGAGSWQQVAKLVAPEAAANAQFGTSVAISGDFAVAGAWADDVAGFMSGAAYLFSRNHGGRDAWGLVTKLIASDASMGSEYGWSVAIDGDTAAVGAIGDRSVALFERNYPTADSWAHAATLSSSGPWDCFGVSVAISGDTLLVSAHIDSEGGEDAGAAYLFERNLGGPGAWGQVAKLTADDLDAGDYFAYSVALSGNLALIGSLRDDEGGDDAGAAYLFARNQGGRGSWGQVAKLVATDARNWDRFGHSVAVSGDAMLSGAWGDDSHQGSAYIFQRKAWKPRILNRRGRR